ncbi:epoxyqueuosine reductase [Deinococcus lacus]|uniref:Epoxyqueuosine reductase n=1 Tax=Deinococcus lacus TaxID=392561 RepID=A0ABW1YAF0_9DEIO
MACLIADLPASAAPEHPDRCGRCFRCGVACPTGAIGPDRQVDARRCVSYLTIEHHGPLPLEWRAGVGDWLFGCDICCAVCPWSLKAGPLSGLLRPQPDLAFPDLSRFFGVSERQFAREWAGSVFLRARRKGMARNALTVLGNTRAAEGWPLVLVGAADPIWEVREAATWALAQWEKWERVEALLADPQPEVAATARTLLEQRG